MLTTRLPSHPVFSYLIKMWTVQCSECVMLSHWFVLDTWIMWRWRWFDYVAAWWRSSSVHKLCWICCCLPCLLCNGLLLLCVCASHDQSENIKRSTVCCSEWVSFLVHLQKQWVERIFTVEAFCNWWLYNCKPCFFEGCDVYCIFPFCNWTSYLHL